MEVNARSEEVWHGLGDRPTRLSFAWLEGAIRGTAVHQVDIPGPPPADVRAADDLDEMLAPRGSSRARPSGSGRAPTSGGAGEAPDGGAFDPPYSRTGGTSSRSEFPEVVAAVATFHRRARRRVYLFREGLGGSQPVTSLSAAAEPARATTQDAAGTTAGRVRVYDVFAGRRRDVRISCSPSAEPGLVHVIFSVEEGRRVEFDRFSRIPVREVRMSNRWARRGPRRSPGAGRNCGAASRA